MQASNKIVKIKSHKSNNHDQPNDHKKQNKHDRKVKRNLKRTLDLRDY